MAGPLKKSLFQQGFRVGPLDNELHRNFRPCTFAMGFLLEFSSANAETCFSVSVCLGAFQRAPWMDVGWVPSVRAPPWSLAPVPYRYRPRYSLFSGCAHSLREFSPDLLTSVAPSAPKTTPKHGSTITGVPVQVS